MSDSILPLRGLQAFDAVVRHMSFTRAAEDLHVTPGAISQQIKALEEQVGFALFERGRELRVAPAAAGVVRQLQTAMDSLRHVSRQLRRQASQSVLVVSVAPSFASRWLIPRLVRFNARWPDVELRLLATRRVVDFATEDVDLAIRYGAGSYPDLHVERLWSESVVAVAHPRIAAQVHQAADLVQTTLLRNSGMNWDTTFPDWPTWLQRANVDGGESVRMREFEEGNYIIEAALAGLGVALVWKSLVADDLAAGRLIALFEEQAVAHAYHLVCPRERLGQAPVEAFRAWLLEEGREPPKPIA
jgi:LysR family glycine cleavage system transcriptional activator